MSLKALEELRRVYFARADSARRMPLVENCAEATCIGLRKLGWTLQTPYRLARPIPGSVAVAELPLPAENRLVHFYVVARHGTRWPTAKRMSQYESLEPLFEVVTHSQGRLPEYSPSEDQSASVSLLVTR